MTTSRISEYGTNVEANTMTTKYDCPREARFSRTMQEHDRIDRGADPAVIKGLEGYKTRTYGL